MKELFSLFIFLHLWSPRVCFQILANANLSEYFFAHYTTAGQVFLLRGHQGGY
jgi:hypothetical protein